VKDPQLYIGTAIKVVVLFSDTLLSYFEKESLIMKNKLKNVIEVYYQSFNASKPELLTKILTEDVYLRDWEIEKHGKKEVIETSSEIMNLPNFDIDILNEIYEGEFAAVDIIVKVNDETLKVIDLFEFENYKIKSIKAYKG
tara:strand:- start:339 stop:761 length:423 start_codon:yes stop_codon:yes gene_type:complete